MIEPVALGNFFLSFFSGSAIILIAVSYTSIYTWAEITGKPVLHFLATAVYIVLLGCVLIFANVLNLHGYWLLIALLMAVGYWWMPRFIFYLAIPQYRGNCWMGSGLPDNGRKWKAALLLLNVGVIGMTIALLIAGYEQSFIERAVQGSSWMGYFAAQNHPWFLQAMIWRMVFGLITFAGGIVLFWDLLTIGKNKPRKAEVIVSE